MSDGTIHHLYIRLLCHVSIAFIMMHCKLYFPGTHVSHEPAEPLQNSEDYVVCSCSDDIGTSMLAVNDLAPRKWTINAWYQNYTWLFHTCAARYVVTSDCLSKFSYELFRSGYYLTIEINTGKGSECRRKKEGKNIHFADSDEIRTRAGNPSRI